MKNEARVDALDGLRGWAALLVLILHVFFQGFPAIDFTPYQMALWQPFSGKFAVHVFFVVSGFSLSISYIRSGSWETLAKIGLGRYLRLVIPIFAVCALVSLMLNAGIIWPANQRPAPYDSLLAFEPTLLHLCKFALLDVFYDHRFADTYAGPLWTISVEFIGTYLVLAVLVLGKFSGARRSLYFILTAVCLLFESSYAAFTFGIILAEAFANGRLSKLRYGWGMLVIGAGLNLVFQSQWSLIAGACIFCLGALVSSGARTFFSSAFSIWLGRISFPLYLIHGPLMFAIGVPLFVWSAGDPISILITGMSVTAATIASAVLL